MQFYLAFSNKKEKNQDKLYIVKLYLLQQLYLIKLKNRTSFAILY